MCVCVLAHDIRNTHLSSYLVDNFKIGQIINRLQRFHPNRSPEEQRNLNLQKFLCMNTYYRKSVSIGLNNTQSAILTYFFRASCK